MNKLIALNNVNQKFIHQVESISKQKVSNCYQCGKCTASCPADFLMDISPNQIMHLIQIGQKDEILNSDSIWVCLSCITCTARCPREIDITSVFNALRIISRKEKRPVSIRNVKLFFDIVLSSIKNQGRLNEVPLLLKYNLWSGMLLNDADLAPSLLGRGKLHFIRRHKVKEIKEIRQIFSRSRISDS
ncbi:MAG: 4Fe-4S dicluster domain-containing protein [Actinobacteria bacterium]|nr:4Fe-4S dicluster domain-containing protein [Actinomycetota bacterium]